MRTRHIVVTERAAALLGSSTGPGRQVSMADPARPADPTANLPAAGAQMPGGHGPT